MTDFEPLPEHVDRAIQLSRKVADSRMEGFTQRIHAERLARDARAAVSNRSTKGGHRYTYIAGLLAALVIGVFTPAIWHNVETHLRSTTTREYTTKRGQLANVELPDGSRVVLGPETKLAFLESHNSRAIKMEGQAYFTVKHNREKPFTVQSGEVVTRVLGTAFSVRAYRTDKVAQIAVTDGKVAFGVGKPVTVLVAGDVGRAGRNVAAVVTHDATINNVVGWTQGLFAFKDTPLRDVVLELEITHDVNIEIADATLGEHLVTVSLTNRSATEILDVIAIAVGARYQQKGRTITLLRK